MAKSYYQTTKTVKVVSKDKVVVKSSSDKVIVKAPGVAGPKGDAGTQILSGNGFPSNLMGKVGDLYIDRLSSTTYGPKLITGWPASVLFQTFNKDLLGQVFNISLQQVNTEVIDDITYGTWHIQHGLGYNPNATCIDSSGRVIEGEISYPNENTIVLRFIGATSGKAYLS
jgi:hypothetical protein